MSSLSGALDGPRGRAVSPLREGDGREGMRTIVGVGIVLLLSAWVGGKLVEWKHRRDARQPLSRAWLNEHRDWP